MGARGQCTACEAIGQKVRGRGNTRKSDGTVQPGARALKRGKERRHRVDKGGGPSDNPGTGNNGIPEETEGEETLHIWRLAHTQAPAGTEEHAGTSAYGRNRAHTNE